MFPTFLVKSKILNQYSKLHFSVITPVMANTPEAAKSAAFRTVCYINTSWMTVDGEEILVQPDFTLLDSEILEIVDTDLASVQEGLL